MSSGRQKIKMSRGCLLMPFSVVAEALNIRNRINFPAVHANRRQPRRPARFGASWRSLRRGISPALLALALAFAAPPVQAQMPTSDVCDRTTAVRNAIVNAVEGVDSCAEVTDTHLAGITSLDLGGQLDEPLKAGDFSGLTALELLHLQGNSLSVLPPGVFNDLRSLQSLRLENNPGSAGFRPIADAGADQAAEAGRALTFRAAANNADPWGDNVARAWTQIDNGGTRVELTGAATATPSFVMPAGATELEFELRVTGRGGAQYMATDTVVLFGVAPTSVAVISDPVQGNSYLLGEVIELALTFDRPVEVDTAGGTPTIGIDVGGVRRRVHYVRGGGSRQLVFAYAVQPADRDLDGIRLCGAGQLTGCTGAISPNGGALNYHSGLGALLRHPSQPDQRGPQGGWLPDGAERRHLRSHQGGARCIGEAARRQRLLRSHNRSAEGFDRHALLLQSSGIVALKPGDFADLISLEYLRLSINNLVTLPAGVFSDLASLLELALYGNRLTALPAGVFSGLASLEVLWLHGNHLRTLPEGLLSGLTELRVLGLHDNSLVMLPEGLFSDLRALETLLLWGNELTALSADTFSGLAALTTLRVGNNSLTGLPENVFSDLRALQDLRLGGNELTALPADIFSGLSALETLHLQNNRLSGLPAGVFNDLRSLDILRLENNPGSGGFRPIANAGADQVAEAGQLLTLRATASAVDPWGDNVAYSWTQTDNSGTRAELTGAGTATVSFIMPAGVSELEFKLRVTGRGTGQSGRRYLGTDRVFVVVVTTSVAVTSAPVQGDVYLLGEVIELALTFNLAVMVDIAGGTPSIELDVGGVRRQAHYVRGGGTRQLVFAYAVQSTDSDGDGIRICGADQLTGCTGAISPNGGALTYHSGLGALLRHPSQPDQEGHRVDGSRTGLSGGICGRTRAVRAELVAQLGAADCSEVTTAQLRGLTGTLSLQSSGIVALKPGDFADLISLEYLRLSSNNLVTLPAGVFSDLASMLELTLYGNRLTALPAGVPL